MNVAIVTVRATVQGLMAALFEGKTMGLPCEGGSGTEGKGATEAAMERVPQSGKIETERSRYYFDSPEKRPTRLFWRKLLFVGDGMRKGELTRERIVAEAAPIFNRQGFAGSSMQDVMEATGLEKGGLYRHFRSKEELAAESFRYALAQAVKLRTDKVDRSHGAVEHLRSIVKRFVDTPSALPGGCPLMNTAIDADDGNAVLRGLVKKAFADWRTRLCVVIEKGIESGEITPKTQPRSVANTMIATLEGALMMSRLEGTKTALQDAQKMLDSLLESMSNSANKATEC